MRTKGLCIDYKSKASAGEQTKKKGRRNWAINELGKNPNTVTRRLFRLYLSVSYILGLKEGRTFKINDDAGGGKKKKDISRKGNFVPKGVGGWLVSHLLFFFTSETKEKHKAGYVRHRHTKTIIK